MTESLCLRAKKIEEWAETHMIDSNGIVYTFIDKNTNRSATSEFFEGYDAYSPPGYTPAEYDAYENCGMTTGAYLQALCFRYDVEKDTMTLMRARRCFEALCYIYNMGKELDEGFFPKIYGNRFSTQTSTDQVLYAAMALDHFSKYATDAEQKEIDRMIVAMVRFWVKRAYRYTYFNLVDMPWPLGRFPSLLLLAFNHSGDEGFKKEYDRLLAMGVNQYPTEEQLRPKLAGLWPPSDYERSQQAWMLINMADCVTMDSLELDYLLRNDPQNQWAPAWRMSMQQMWNEGKLTFAMDGTCYTSVLIDFETKEVRRLEPKMLEPGIGDALDGWSFSRYIHGASSGWSTMLARAGIQVYQHISDDPSLPSTVLNILRSINLDGLTYYNEPERFLPQHRYLTNFVSGDALGSWLWAYWLGRKNGLIDHEI
jgi:hypothetical protein